MSCHHLPCTIDSPRCCPPIPNIRSLPSSPIAKLRRLAPRSPWEEVITDAIDPTPREILDSSSHRVSRSIPMTLSTTAPPLAATHRDDIRVISTPRETLSAEDRARSPLLLVRSPTSTFHRRRHPSTASGFARAREIVRVGEEKRKETAKRRATVAARQGVAVGRRWTARLAVVRGAMTVSPLSHERRQRPHQTTPRAHSLPLHSPRRPLASPCLGPTNAILIGRKGGIQPRNDFPRCPAALFSSLYFFLRPSDLSLSFFPGSSIPLQRILLRPFSPIS